MSRKTAMLGFGILSFFMLIMVGITAPDTENQSNISPQDKTRTSSNIYEKSSQRVTPKAAKPTLYEVVRVIDGDTVVVNVEGKDEKIRVIGINAPESTNKTECFGKKASEKAEQILSNTKVKLIRDDNQSNRDKYNRLLRYVLVDGKLDFGKTMIEGGYAYEYTYSTPYKYQKQYKQTQVDAEKNSNGLWSPKTCDGKEEVKTTQKDKPKATESTNNIHTPRTPTQKKTSSKPSPSSGVVKMSNSRICHAPGTTYYSKTKNFTPYNTLQACLNAGGRLPKR